MLGIPKKDQGKVFFLFILLTALLITLAVTIGGSFNVNSGAKRPTKTSFIYNLNAGWNAIAVPLDGIGASARSLCNEIAGSVTVARWQDQSWQYYECNQKPRSENFRIEFNRGYFIRVDNLVTWKVMGFQSVPNYSLVEGWNFFGIIPTTADPLVAENLCGPFGETTMTVSEISGWKNGGWNTHLCQLPAVNNFQLTNGAAYFIKASAVGQTPTKVTIPALKSK